MKKTITCLLLATVLTSTPAFAEMTLEQHECMEAYFSRHNFVWEKCEKKFSTCVGKLNHDHAEMCIAGAKMFHWTYDDLKKCNADIDINKILPCSHEHISCNKELSKVLQEMKKECGIPSLNQEDQ